MENELNSSVNDMLFPKKRLLVMVNSDFISLNFCFFFS